MVVRGAGRHEYCIICPTGTGACFLSYVLEWFLNGDIFPFASRFVSGI